MPSINQLFASLSLQKSKLDVNPFLDVTSQRRLDSAYRLLHDMTRPTNRQQTSKKNRVKQHLRNADSIARALFVTISVTVTVTDLGFIAHDELFPRLEHWWHDNPPSPRWESRSVEYVEELDKKREQNLLHVRETSHAKRRKARGRTKQSRDQTLTSEMPSAPEPLNQTTRLEFYGANNNGAAEDTAAHILPSASQAVVTNPGVAQSYTMNPLDQETIPFDSSELIDFLNGFQEEYPHLRVICELLRTCDPNLRLPYSLFGMVPPYIQIGLQLPPGLGFNIEMSSEFSYQFVEYLLKLKLSQHEQ